uniref:Anti-proliferative protein domain-containing protein n=1 Tax=Sinocyclocheilus grahami TaxID=75366 RepID=A0A672MRM0_SINGR
MKTEVSVCYFHQRFTEQQRLSLEIKHYQHHWFPQAPCRGSGYRCLRINCKMDPLKGKAASAVGFTQEQLFSSLPTELTLWVDPYEVSYRIGEDGSICVLYKSSPLRPKSATSADTSAHRKEKLKTRRSNRSRRFNVMEGSLL